MSKPKNVEVLFDVKQGKYEAGERYVVMPEYAAVVCGSPHPKAVRIGPSDKPTYVDELVKGRKASATAKSKEEKAKKEKKD